MGDRYVVKDAETLTAAGYGDWVGDGWGLFDTLENRVVGADGGEPEDQLLLRDWKWVPEEMNKLAAQLAAANERIAKREQEIARAWAALGVDPEEAADDPETAELADSIRVSLQFERDKVEHVCERVSEIGKEYDGEREARERADQQCEAWEKNYRDLIADRDREHAARVKAEAQAAAMRAARAALVEEIKKGLGQ